ncbi:MAG: ammonium transporter [Candidatus Altiarchaeia archaeon]
MARIEKKTALAFAMLLVLLLTPLYASAEEAESKPDPAVVSGIDTVWTLVAAFLVFFMQAGFAFVETGLTRAKCAGNIMMKNMMDFAMGSIAYFLVGFGIMFGAGNAFFGSGFFMLDGFTPEAIWPGLTIPSFAFWMFQIVFAATAATIVSGAMAERVKFMSYIAYSFLISLIIYPIVGHWIWGGGWLVTGDVLPFLKDAPFIDFAGSTVVHFVGGVTSFIGCLILGPRIGRYGKDGKPNAMPGHNITLVVMGVFFLWFGWFGFNPGSTLSGMNPDIATIAVTTNLAGAAGAITAMFLTWFMSRKADIAMTCNGALAGLVAITAGCAVVSPLSSIIIGGLAGVIVVYAVYFFDSLRIDDPVGAISVHGVCGAFGTICVGLFAEKTYSGGVNGLFFGGGFAQLITQTIGVVSVFAFVAISAFLMFKLIQLTIGLRVTPEEELRGLDQGEHGMSAYPDFMPTYDPIRR